MSKKKSNATRRAETLATREKAAAVRREQERAERRRRNVVVGIAVFVVLLLVGGIGYAVQSSRDATGETAAPPSGITDEYALVRGDAGAQVTVTVYEDFMCPYCGQFEAASRDTLDSLVDSGDVKVEYRVISFLDRASNGTDYSTRAMNALGAVLDTAGTDAALAFHDKLYEHQPAEGSDGLSDDQLVKYAVESGAAEATVRAPIEDRAFEGWVVNATDAANKDGVSSTPTVQVDGTTLEYTTTDELVTELQKAVEAAQAG
ncbi:DsbA family protein [Nocardioides iriomotensis]|uniref:Disulfide bond formation protein DsbA n=1 Tax=Nocardioides iriomotensis TaxID=715784 RepID=A0A4V1Z236_9ACTN|nr:thioredoxin domain-containing protein [Nocardioides iriomotensis]RYU13036.1 disulfide bond formation protein DsbA [Nocardioides iriomotensis]